MGAFMKTELSLNENYIKRFITANLVSAFFDVPVLMLMGIMRNR